MTPAEDMTVDYPHGTTIGYRRGCKGRGECPGGYGQTCVEASVRAHADYQYSRAVAKDREVDYLERTVNADVPPVKSAKVARAGAQQRKQHRAPGQPLVTDSYDDPTVPDATVDRAADTAFHPDPSDRLDGWDRTDAIARGEHEDGRPFHAPTPPLPTEPTVYDRLPSDPPAETIATLPVERCPRTDAHAPHAWTRGLGAYVSEDRDTQCPGRLLPAGFEVFDRQTQRSHVNAANQRGRTPESRRASAQAATVAQRERALATASAEHPLGLKLDGTPRTRPAKGTRLGADGRLHDVSGERPPKADITAEQATAAFEAVFPPPATAPTPPAPTVPGATLADMEDAAAAADRVAAILADTDWREVARSLNRIADAMEKLRGLA